MIAFTSCFDLYLRDEALRSGLPNTCMIMDTWLSPCIMDNLKEPAGWEEASEGPEEPGAAWVENGSSTRYFGGHGKWL